MAAAGARRPRRSTRSRRRRCRASSRFRFATDAEIASALGCEPGYLGPGRRSRPSASSPTARVAADERLRLRRERGRLPPHRRQLGPRPARAARSPTSATSSPATRRPTARARSRSCAASRSGHIFQLRHQVLRSDEARPSSTRTAKPQPMEMGCYGIGVTRIVAAAIEQNHDERGIIWPDADRAVRGGAGADRLPQERRACARPPSELHDELRRRRHRRAARRPRRAPGRACSPTWT